MAAIDPLLQYGHAQHQQQQHQQHHASVNPHDPHSRPLQDPLNPQAHYPKHQPYYLPPIDRHQQSRPPPRSEHTVDPALDDEDDEDDEDDGNSHQDNSPHGSQDEEASASGPGYVSPGSSSTMERIQQLINTQKHAKRPRCKTASRLRFLSRIKSEMHHRPFLGRPMQKMYKGRQTMYCHASNKKEAEEGRQPCCRA
jgi:hypothetical protein